MVLLACATSGGATPGTTAGTTATPISTETAALRLDNGAVEVQDENNTWMPIGGETTFELVGELQNTDPWMVTGNTFATRDSTQIAEGLEVGDRVRVRGIILEDHIWLANSIELAEVQSNPTLILIGIVDAIDPWTVNGIQLNVTSDTVITGDITAGMLVQVEILLMEDGNWEVLSIDPLSDFTEIPGCATVTATIVSVNGSEVQFAGWPVITLDEGLDIANDYGDEGTLSADQHVLIVVCASEDGEIVITKIIILATDDGTSANGEKVLICHKPDKKGGHTLSIAEPAVPAHLAHGDKLGPCPQR
jgi:hypothetical protein